MSSTSAPLGRRERNKQEKLERITRAAADLFSQHGVDEVTTQQVAEAADEAALVDAVVALVTPIVECNRAHVENGRTYLREMVFGDPAEPHHAAALAIVARTEEALADIVVDRAGRSPEEAVVLARVVSAVLMVAMASAVDESIAVLEVVAALRAQLEVVLRGE